jgi:putative ABC transport system permease protein
VKIWELFTVAVQTLWANRLRSALTMIGIIIGTASVIAIFGLGQSAASSIGATLGMFGNQGIFILPDQNSSRFRQAKFQWHDIQVIRDQCTRCAKVFPFYDSFYTMRRGHARDSFELSSDTDYILDRLPMAEGRRFTSDDVDAARPVANILWPAKQKLFGAGPAVGKYVRIAGHRFLVVGVYQDISAGIFNTFVGSGDSISIPYTTYHKLPGSVIEGIQLYAAPGVPASRVIDEVEGILKRLHGTRTQYQGIDSSQQSSTFLNVIAYVAVGISSIGAIALIVGGIGVMNIMMVSVMERTREIGIRKAIGASRSDILMQFLTESIAITLIGGAMGTLLGALAALAGSAFLDKQFAGNVSSINWFPILFTALGSSLAIGLFFGTYPAVRASRLAPIDCLRHE